MGADAFQAEFEGVFAPVADAIGLLRRRSTRRLCWTYGRGALALAFDFALNPKATGLLPHYPGEFALTISLPGNSPSPLATVVSLFQYTTAAEVDAYVAVEDRALANFVAGNPAAATLFPPDLRRPAPNVAQWCHYVTRDDVRAWAQWYAGLIPLWIPRYLDAPESLEDWCWRVLWKDQKRDNGTA
ncbi:hypothetical protein P873_00725 [Arenimonas composti TR7-09 = DSM 18010]|uniref:Uncharacterized protein n=2 Tax=Arenimonas TaxID=490567 RepID=A0A091C2R8_9GAMM|nr:hypothetical protein [Arenimonas composti]KFN50905.1 hypothetical protein P873_00725 [Arenimonas composti TR7-09 = DSM 18010]